MRRKSLLTPLLFIYFISLIFCTEVVGSSKGEIEIYFFYDSEPCGCHPEEKAANKTARQSLRQANEKYQFKLWEYDTDEFAGGEEFMKYQAAYGGLLRTPVILIGNDYIVGFKSKDKTVKKIIKFIEKYKKDGFYPNPPEIVNLYQKMDKIESVVRKSPETKSFFEKALLTGKRVYIRKDIYIAKWFSPQGILQAELSHNLELLNISIPTIVEAKTEIATITHSIPFSDRINLSALNLPLITFLIALVDSFNPCVIFILLFLLSLLLKLHSRGRILLVGTIFVLVTGIFYFLFMTLWLNLFLLTNFIYIDYVKFAVGVIAIIVGSINIKEFFFFKQGLSLTIPEGKKNQLFGKMHNLFSKPTLKSIIPATIGIALFANLIELPCTGGFPPIYTMLLKINALQPFKYYLYLLMYNFIYILPEIIIVIFTAFTFATKKLTEKHGRILKIISGIILLGLGFMLIYT